MRLFHLIMLLSLTSACVVGPEYKQPQRELPQQWTSTSDYLATEETDQDWWASFEDSTLSGLIERGVEVNHDVRMALARVAEARAGVTVASGEYLPEVNGQVSVSRGKASENGQEPGATFFRQGLASPYQNMYNLGFDASWEFDLFGRIKRGVEAATARYDVALAGAAQTRLVVASETARLYFLYLGLEARAATIQRRVEIRGQIAELVKIRREAGLVSDLEVVQSTALVSQAKAVLPGIRAEQIAVIHGLASLLDLAPEEVSERIQVQEALPAPPQRVALQTPVSLLSRRPDLVLAERTLAAAVADIGVAEGNLYPRVSIAALFGLEATSSGNFFEGDSFTGLLQPRVSIPIFNRNRIRAGIDAAEARRDGAIAAWEKAVVGALSDVGTAIARHEGHRDTYTAIREAEADGMDALAKARELYDLGLRDFQVVLDTERTLTQLVEARVDAETQMLVSSVALYKAMGGGWN